MNGQGSSNQQQARPTVGPAALTPRVRRELEQRANVFSEDGSVIVTQTARGKALRAKPDVVATLLWDPDTLIAKITFDYLLNINSQWRRRQSGYDEQTALYRTSYARQHWYEVDLSSVTTVGGLLFCLPCWSTTGTTTTFRLPTINDELAVIADTANATAATITRSHKYQGTVITAAQTITDIGITTLGALDSWDMLAALASSHASGSGFPYRDLITICALRIEIDAAGNPVPSLDFHYGTTREAGNLQPLPFSYDSSTRTLTLANHRNNFLAHGTPGNGVNINPLSIVLDADDDVSIHLEYDPVTHLWGLTKHASTQMFQSPPVQELTHIILDGDELQTLRRTAVPHPESYTGLRKRDNHLATAPAELDISLTAFDPTATNILDGSSYLYQHHLQIDRGSGRILNSEREVHTQVPDPPQELDVYAKTGERLRLRIFEKEQGRLAQVIKIEEPNGSPAYIDYTNIGERSGGAGYLTVRVYSTGAVTLLPSHIWQT